jgi:NAD(P)-dependent dehydrogenase (short-subunit alcohol dehydrogenase family)
MIMQRKVASKFGKHTLAAEVAEGLDLRGKTAIVTGGTAGLGRETTRVLAMNGAHVIFTARDAAKGQKLAEEFRTITRNPQVDVAVLDLFHVESATKFAEQMLWKFPKLDLLILNAATANCPLARNELGIESQFMTNYVGHLIVAAILAPALITAAPSRIITLTSAGHQASPIIWEDINFERRDYQPMLGYAQSKTAMSLLAVELNRRLASRRVLAFTVRPGMVPDTNLSRYSNPSGDKGELMATIRALGFNTSDLKSIEAGTATTIWAATAEELENTAGGLYLEDCQIAEQLQEPNYKNGFLSYAVDKAGAHRLWQMTESMLGQTFKL